MKKTIAMFALVVLAIASFAIAGTWYSRSTVSLAVTTGAATWTNATMYSSIALKRIWIYNGLAADNTVTVTRVTSDSPVTTQTVGTITVASNAGNQSTFTAAYLRNGDKLVFASQTATGSTAMVEYEISQP